MGHQYIIIALIFEGGSESDSNIEGPKNRSCMLNRNRYTGHRGPTWTTMSEMLYSVPTV